MISTQVINAEYEATENNASIDTEYKQNQQADTQNGEYYVAGVHSIYKKYESSATSVLFLQSEQGEKRAFCAKIWLPCLNEVYDTSTREKRYKYTITGLEFNRQLASSIYWGIASITQKDEKVILGELIKDPSSTSLDSELEYALIMEELEQSNRLDLQLQSTTFDKDTELQNLAHQIAKMHKSLPGLVPQQQEDVIGVLRKKWQLNQACLQKAIKKIKSPLCYLQSLFLYLRLYLLMPYIHKNFGKEIQQRQDKVKHCHGDLKTNNIWVVEKQYSALDCVDFQPDFCNIDTLSDIAMLVMDLETQLSQQPGLQQRKVPSLIKNFTNTYLDEMSENTKLSHLLLEYYIVEKAIVCSYMCILFDSEYNSRLLKQGERYLKTAKNHAKRLKSRVRTSWLQLIVSEFSSLISKQIKTRLFSSFTLGATNPHDSANTALHSDC